MTPQEHNSFQLLCLLPGGQCLTTQVSVGIFLLYNTFVCTVEFFQVLLFSNNNSIKHQSFVYTQLYDQTIPFQTFSLLCQQS